MTKRTTFFALALAGLMSLVLFVISYQVQDLERELDALNRDIVRDSQAVHVLRAEWSHLNDPMRLRALSERYLGLEPIETNQVGEAEDLPWNPVMKISGDPDAAASGARTPRRIRP